MRDRGGFAALGRPQLTGALLALVLFSGGCEVADTRPILVGMYGGAPDAEALPELGSDAAALAVLARPISATDLQQNLVRDADRVWIDIGLSESAVEVDLVHDDGKYEAESDEQLELTYTPGASYRINAELDDELRTLEMTAPLAPVLFGVPEPGQHPAGQSITVELVDQAFDGLQWVVLDVDGEPTAEGRPDGTGETLDWLIEDEPPAMTIEIPGDAFPTPQSAYTIGVFGMVRAPRDAFDGFGATYSTFGMGAFTTEPVLTAP